MDMLRRDVTEFAEAGAAGASTALLMGPRVDRGLVARVAAEVDRAGLESSAGAVRSIARRAQDLGVSSVLVEILLDAGEPAVVRERAFGRISAFVDSHLPITDVRTELVA